MLSRALAKGPSKIWPLLWLALNEGNAGKSSAGTQYAFVFRPGATGTLPSNVFTTQAALRTAMRPVQGPKILEIDGSGGGATTFTGVVDFLQDTTIVSVAAETLLFAAGATITGVSKLALGQAIALQNSGTVVWTISGTAQTYLSELSGISGSAGAGFINVPGGANFDMVLDSGAGIGDTANAVITGTGTVGMNNVDGVVVANAMGAGLTWNYAISATSELDFPQGSTPNFTYFAPPNILQELDTGHGAASTITSNSAGTIRRVYSGRTHVHVQATFTQAGGAPGNVTMTLQRDGSNIVGAPTAEVSIASGSLAQLDIDWIDTLPDAATHHYGWTATTSAGTIAVTSGQAAITVVEEK